MMGDWRDVIGCVSEERILEMVMLSVGVLVDGFE